MDPHRAWSAGRDRAVLHPDHVRGDHWSWRGLDVAELARGKSGRLIGHLAGFLATLKGLPFAYNRDLQEDKEAVFDALDTARASTRLMGLMLEGASFRTDRMRAALAGDLSNATDLADFLAAGADELILHGVVGEGLAPLADYLAAEEG